MNKPKVSTNRLFSSGSRLLRQLFKAASFWGGVALPVLYLPLLFSGLETDFERVVLFGLLLLHAVLLLIGQTYDTDGE